MININSEKSQSTLPDRAKSYISFRLKKLTIFVFCLYVFWGSFGIDMTLHPDAERFPLHRLFIFLTLIIFLFNAQSVISAIFKNKILVFTLFYILLTAAWASKPEEVAKNFIFLSSITIISVMTALAFSDNKIGLVRYLFWLFFFMIIASIMVGQFMPNLGVDILNFGRPRWIGITAHPNALGVQALVLIWLSANLYGLTKRKSERFIILIAIGSGFFALIKADSMTSFFSSIAIIGLVIYFYMFGKSGLGIKITIWTFVAIAFFILISFYMSASDLADVTLASAGRNTTFTGRSLLWEYAFKALSERTVTGYGFDNLSQLTIKFHTEMSHLHNGYIEVLTKGGLVAGSLLTALLIKTYISQLLFKKSNSQEYLLLNSGLVMILLHNIAESSFFRGLSTLSIFIIFIMASTSLVNKNAQPS